MVNEEKIKVAVMFKCPICNRTFSITLPSNLYTRVMLRGITKEHIQDILKDYPASKREAFISGVCNDCFDALFADFEDIECLDQGQ